MPIPRRQFLKTTAGLTAGTFAASLPFSSMLTAAEQPRTAVFWDDAFSAADRRQAERTALERGLNGMRPQFLTASALAAQLTRSSFDLLVLPYGPHFPAELFPSVIAFLSTGGALLNIGGTPFAFPWRREPDGMRSNKEVNFHKQLGITQSYTVNTDGCSVQANPVIARSEELKKSLRNSAADAFYYRLAETNDFPAESGTTGTQDAVVTPIVWCTDSGGVERVAPLVQMDHPRGAFGGGRWVFYTGNGMLDAGAITILAERAVSGTLALAVRPEYACYRAGEIPVLQAQFRAPGTVAERHLTGNGTIEVLNARGKSLFTLPLRWNGSGAMMNGTASFTRKNADLCMPGRYTVILRQSVNTDSGKGETLTARTGFWIFDEALLHGGSTFTTDGDYLLKDGTPFPIAGTTYMSGDAHRKFLFEPNVQQWHDDLTRMKETGIGMVRTGIWTGWRNYMLDPGVMNEAAMRALDAFLLTARSHDIPVIFTFFAFLPELWNGENAYLDPRSVEAQKEFVALIVRRYAGMKDVVWDLINEPSFCNPDALWSCRPNGDRYEQRAWSDWLRQRYPAASEGERDAQLRAQYRIRPDESLGLPSMGDFSGAAILYDKRPLKTIDYRYFAQQMFAQWSAAMTTVIRTNSNGAQLVTVGQDEAGTGDSPSPHFFGSTVDFTSLHNWWANDDLVWDSVMTKVAGKANLIEETGVMFYERMDGSPFRTEQDAAMLLDRKIALSIGTGGAGFIQWIWNINPLMKNDNEATIGLMRADGTFKPEYDVLRKYAAFLNTHRSSFSGRARESVVLYLSHGQMFSPRNSASEASKRAVRTLTYGLGLPVRSVSDSADASLLAGAALIVVPAPRTLSDNGWNALRTAATNGATVMISGVIDDDPFYRSKGRSATLGVTASVTVITQEESVRFGGAAHRFSFRGDRIQQLDKADCSASQIQEVLDIPLGKGRILWCPVPVENSDSPEAIRDYYRFCMQRAGVSAAFTAEGDTSSLLILPQEFRDHVLYTLVNEGNEDVTVQLTHRGTSVRHAVTISAQQAVLLMLHRSTGALIGRSSG